MGENVEPLDLFNVKMSSVFFSLGIKIIIWVCFILTLLLVLTFLILKINLSLLGKLPSIKQFLSDSCDLLTQCEGGVWSKTPPMSKRSLSLSGGILLISVWIHRHSFLGQVLG